MNKLISNCVPSLFIVDYLYRPCHDAVHAEGDGVGEGDGAERGGEAAVQPPELRTVGGTSRLPGNYPSCAAEMHV